jgi:hypothetical protein
LTSRRSSRSSLRSAVVSPSVRRPSSTPPSAAGTPARTSSASSPCGHLLHLSLEVSTKTGQLQISERELAEGKGVPQ